MQKFVMLFLFSPSKDLDMKSEAPIPSQSIPALWAQAWPIVELMKRKKPKALMSLMDISEKLAIENVNRYSVMSDKFQEDNSKPAIFAFSGDVYRGLDIKQLPETAQKYCIQHLRILSGLYGVLRPLDAIQAYRLEMGVSLKVGRKKNLVTYWSDLIYNSIQEEINSNQFQALINLSSQEYFQVLENKKFDVPLIHIHFREQRNGKLQFVSFNAKKARGLMLRFASTTDAKKKEDLLKFDLESYRFETTVSDENNWYFTR